MQYKKWIGRQELEQDIKSGGPHLVIFAAKWCGYCRRFLQIVDAYGSNSETPAVALVDADSGDGSLWDDYNISVVPTIAVYLNGKQTYRKEARFGAGLGETDFEQALKKASH